MLLFVQPAPESGGQQATFNYDPTVQTWRPVESEDGKVTHWIGWEIERPPTSRDLIRPQITEGLPLNLNGSPYVIPLAKLPDTDLSQLPKRFVWRKGGIQQVVKDRYADICVRCQKQFEWILTHLGIEALSNLEAEDFVFEPYERFYLCADLLNVNYRVSGPECCELGIVDSKNMWYIIKYSIGWQYWEAEQRVRAPKEEPGKAPATLSAT
ncbi:MAG TPA: hypothetical protein VFG04_14070 [Planctomycetaceae bacterium]|nr:hypothetical protein [Planctomycetaceae bacterium]